LRLNVPLTWHHAAKKNIKFEKYHRDLLFTKYQILSNPFRNNRRLKIGTWLTHRKQNTLSKLHRIGWQAEKTFQAICFGSSGENVQRITGCPSLFCTLQNTCVLLLQSTDNAEFASVT